MNIRRSSIVVAMLLLYAFLAPLGGLMRWSPEEGAYGVTSVLLILIALCALPVSVEAFQREPVFLAFGVLIAWLIGASAFAPDTWAALVNGGSLVLYLLAAITAFCYLRDEPTILRLLIAFCLGGLLSALATIIDLVGIIDIPGINDNSFGTQTELGVIIQASGPFARRSAMGAYYTLIISMGILLPMLYRNLSIKKKLFFFGAAGLCLITLMLTHSRAGVLSAALAVGIILISDARSPVRLLKVMVAMSVIATLLVAAVNIWFPDTWIAYQALTGIGQGAYVADFQRESDKLRVVFAQHALASMLSNPIGHGYSPLAGLRGYEGSTVDPHNNLSQVIWGGGLFGLIWLIVFGSRAAMQCLRLLRSNRSKEPTGQLLLVLLGAMLAFMLTGMAHTIISTGIAWVLFGTLLHLVRSRQVVARFASKLH